MNTQNNRFHKLYLDDIRKPKTEGWTIIRNYSEFVHHITIFGIPDEISFDHDLGDSAIEEYYSNVEKNNKLDYDHISEKTGYDCAKYVVEKFYLENPDRENMKMGQKSTSEIRFPTITVHSANPIGAQNIIGYLNNFLKYEGQPENCVRVQIPHTIKNQ